MGDEGTRAKEQRRMFTQGIRNCYYDQGMKYGIGVVPAGEVDVHALAELAHLAEAAGWDGFFIEDYITHWLAPDAPTLDPWIGLAAAAMRTKRIRLGIAVTPLGRRRPWKVAREAVTLDHLSNGRLILGVGLGATSLNARASGVQVFRGR